MDEYIQSLEAAMVAAHNAGDAASAKKLADQITKLLAVSPQTRVMFEALKNTPKSQWRSRMTEGGYPDTIVNEVMQASGVEPDFSGVESGSSTGSPPRTAPTDSGFTFAREQNPQDMPRPTGRDVSVIAPPGTAGIPSLTDFAAEQPPSQRELGRQAALERDSKTGAALHGYTSFAGFGAGVPATAAAVMASRVLPGGKPPIGPGDAMEYARGVRRGSYEANPGTYRTGAVAGIAGGAGLISGAVKSSPATVRNVFSLQDGQTWRNLLRLMGAGAAGAGAAAGSEQGAEAVPLAMGVGAVAGPAVAGLVRGGSAVVGAVAQRISPQAAAIRLIAERTGEPASAVAARYNEFVARTGKAPRLIEIMREETAEELGMLSQGRFVGSGAAQVFREAESAAATARAGEIAGSVRQGGPTATVPGIDSELEPAMTGARTLASRSGPTATVPGIDAELEPAVTGARTAVGRRPQSTLTDEIGARDVEMDRVMAEIGGHRVPANEDILSRIQSPEVWNNLDPLLRRRIAGVIEAAEEMGIPPSFRIRTWDAMRQEIGKKAAARPEVGEYASLRNRLRDYVSARSPEYGAALQDFGRRTDFAEGVEMGTRALTLSAREFAAQLRTAGGGTAAVAQRPDVRAATQAGAPLGVRAALIAALSGPPDKAAKFMERLARDATLRANLRLALDADEAAELMRLAGYYGRTLDLRAGVAVGQRVTARVATERYRDAIVRAGATQEGAEGVGRGARASLISALSGPPAKAARFMERLARDSELRANLRLALSPEEITRLEVLSDYYGRTLNLREGVEVGRKVMTRNTGEGFEDAVERAVASSEGREGVARGARGALADAAQESPVGAIATATRMAKDEGLFRRLSAAFGDTEAGRLRDVGEMHFRSARNLAAAAPSSTAAQMRAQEAARQVQEVIGFGVVALGKTSGAMKANIVSSLIQRLRISKRGATRAAELMTDPDPTGKTQAMIIQRLRRQGLTATEISQIYQNAAVAAGLLSGTAVAH